MINDLTIIKQRYNEVINQYQYSKDKSNQYGEVFTPEWLVDKMVAMVGDRIADNSLKTLDLCAGYGQFTMGMIRAKEVHGITSTDWLLNHYFCEIQESSREKLKYIFGDSINWYDVIMPIKKGAKKK